MHVARAVLTGALLLNAATTQAAVTTTVVDIQSGGATQRFLYLRPDAPVANIVLIPGGDGVLGIQPDGAMTGFVGSCDPVARNREAFPAHGYALALVDAKSNGVKWQSADILEVVGYLRDRDRVPTWIVGGSATAPAIVGIAASIPASVPGGVIFHIPGNFSPGSASVIRRPTLVMFHTQDPFAAQSQALFDLLTAAPAKELVSLSGGSNETGCPVPGGFHIYNGLDAEFIAATTGFIAKYNPTLVDADIAVIEYYHAAFDHYFVTGIADEIAKLDNGTFAGWARTGKKFNAYASGTPSTAATCRFFSTSFGEKSSHFYTSYASECATVKANPNWQFEGEVFNVAQPAADGTCAPPTVPVYRVYNNGQGGAPNHRFVTSLADRQTMLDKGYVAEGAGIGVGMCTPPDSAGQTAEGFWRGVTR